MNDKHRYFYLFVLTAFLAGQVQYAYISYFCTEQHVPVAKPSVEMNSAQMSTGSKTCDECQGFIPAYHGQALAQTNCIQVRTLQKSTVGSFAELNKNHFSSSTTFVLSLTQSRRLPITSVSGEPISQGDSPPCDLPVFNSILRI